MNRKNFYICLFILMLFTVSINSLKANSINGRISLTSAGYYPDYTWDSAIWGFYMRMDLFDLFGGFGIGGSVFQSIKWFNKSAQDLSSYELYIHRFQTISYEGDSWFKSKYLLHGPFFGLKWTDLYYLTPMMEEPSQIRMCRPEIGYEIATDYLGAIIKWTQDEEKKSRMQYELKLSSYGAIFQVGGDLQRKVFGVPSDFHFYSGMEFSF